MSKLKSHIPQSNGRWGAGLVCSTLLACTMFGLASCGVDPTDPALGHLGITRTDTLGFIQSFDPNDWCLDHVVITDHIYVSRDRAYFICEEPGDTTTATLRVLNHSHSSVEIEVMTDLTGLSLDPTGITLAAGADFWIAATYIQQGDDVHQGHIMIRATPDPAPVLLPAQGQLSSGGVVFVPPGDSFGPAYPNPAKERVYLPISVTPARQAIITIHPPDGAAAFTIFAGNLTAGPHRVEWNCRDPQGDLVAPGIYAAHILSGDLDCSGDIEVVR